MNPRRARPFRVRFVTARSITDDGATGSMSASAASLTGCATGPPSGSAVDAPFRLLFVGYLRNAKGIDTLLESFEWLLEREKWHIELSIVRAAAIEDRWVADKLRVKVRTVDRANDGALRGHKAFGAPLLSAGEVERAAALLNRPSRGGD